MDKAGMKRKVQAEYADYDALRFEYEAVGQWLREMGLIFLRFESAIEAIDRVRKTSGILVLSQEKEYVAEFEKLLVRLNELPTPKTSFSKECKRAKSYFKKAINAHIKAFKAFVADPKSKAVKDWVSVEADMMRESFYNISLLLGWYQK
jgi:hypothetical protein